MKSNKIGKLNDTQMKQYRNQGIVRRSSNATYDTIAILTDADID